jgi:tRNA G37 N-methylase Trm5
MNQVTFHQTRRGVMAHYQEDQVLNQSLAYYGEWAEDEIKLLSNYISEGNTVLDIGANVGTHTLAFAELVGLSGQVVAIEANPPTFVLLSNNIVQNNLVGRVTAIQAVAGDRTDLVPHTIGPVPDSLGGITFVPAARTGWY